MQVTYWFIIKGESWTVALCYLVFDLNVGMTLTSDNSMLTWILGQRLYEIIPYIAKKTVTMYMITLYDRKMSFSLKFSWGFGHITEKSSMENMFFLSSTSSHTKLGHRSSKVFKMFPRFFVRRYHFQLYILFRNMISWYKSCWNEMSI